jgi:hypothetical protein
LLAQLSLWYQARPCRVGESTLITLDLSLDDTSRSSWPAVTLRPTDTIEVAAGPVRIQSKHQVCWDVRPKNPGNQLLEFEIGSRTYSKEFAAGEGLKRISRVRPSWNWLAILSNPWEPPFHPGDPVRSIEIDYPNRSSSIYGIDTWLIYWFAVSMFAALCVRRAMNVAL